MRGHAAVALLILGCAAGPAGAQTPPAPVGETAGAADDRAFLSRFAFHVGMEHVFSDDPRFVWDAHWGGDLDLVDYGRGAVTFLAQYRTMLGEEFRAFDPVQGDYTLEGSASARVGAVELAGVFHHVSRHLSDRPKRFPVDWNMVGGRVRSRLVRGRTDLRTHADVRSAIQKSYVDYDWEAVGGGRVQVQMSPQVALIGLGSLRLIGVDGSRLRGRQYGWRGDGGIRLEGRRAALELYVAGERRIDPYQLEFSTSTWLTTGFRLMSR